MGKQRKLYNWKEEVKRLRVCEDNTDSAYTQLVNLLPVCEKLGFDNAKIYLEELLSDFSEEEFDTENVDNC